MSRISARRRQTYHSTLRQKGKDVMLVLPPTLKWPHWRAGQRIWFQMRAQAVVITQRPTGPRGRQRYCARIRQAHVSLIRARAERLALSLTRSQPKVFRGGRNRLFKKSGNSAPKTLS
jgi:hypothetical protein